MQSIDFILNAKTGRYEAVLMATGAVRIRVSNPQPKGVVAMDVFALDGSGDNPILLARMSSYNNLMDKMIPVSAFPVQLLCSLTFEPGIAEVQIMSGGGSGGSVDSAVIEAIHQRLAQQERVNADQQKQIDNNTRVNEEQEEKIIDGSAIAPAETIEDLFK